MTHTVLVPAARPGSPATPPATAAARRSLDDQAVPAASPRRLARIAGALYLVKVVAGAFAIGYVQAQLFASDPAVTAANIEAHESLYRAGLAAHVLVTVTNVPLAVIFYELFRSVNRRLALLDAFFILVATAIEAAGILHQFAPLVLLPDAAASNAQDPQQLQRLLSLTGPLAQADYTLYTVFFALDILLMSYLL